MRAKFERPRARRYPFVASIELTDLQSETHMRGQTSNLSLFGCHADIEELMPTGTAIRVRIVRAGANFVARGKVAYAIDGRGMGIAFTEIEPNKEVVLEKWIDELR